MEYIFIGKIVNTHGIKGEVRILSDIEYKKDIFKINNNLYIGNKKDKEIIKKYRVHKNYDMILFENIDNINDVLKYKGKDVFIKKDEINYTGYFDEELIGLDVYSKDKYIGKIVEVLKSKANDILVIKDEQKKYMVPKIDYFIDKVDIENNKIYINEIKGLFE